MLRTLAHNWELKVLAVVIAFALWVFVGSGDRVRIALAAPVEYIGLPGELILIASRDTVDLELEVPRWNVGRLSAATLRVRVNVASMGEGESTIPLSPGQVEAPPGTAVTRITPSRVRVVVAAAVTKNVPVVPQIRGVPALDHVIHRVVVDPSAVEVRGPRSTLEAETVVETLPVDVSGSRTSVTRTVGLVTPEAVSLARERTVAVTVEIQPKAAMQRGPRGARK